jgi:hypothetical protein
VEQHHPTTATHYVENTTDIKHPLATPQPSTKPPASPMSTHPTEENSSPSKFAVYSETTLQALQRFAGHHLYNCGTTSVQGSFNNVTFNFFEVFEN